MKYKITAISDTHGLHSKLNGKLPGGDLIIHSGDISNRGFKQEVREFLDWFSSLDNYTHKVFIAGNHDFFFEEAHEIEIWELLNMYPNVTYLKDDFVEIGLGENKFKVYGSPYQPEFNQWAFNLPRRGDALYEKWKEIPTDADILITHGPPNEILDLSNGNINCGCELLNEEIFNRVKPKFHIFGHIHEAYGYTFREGTHFINASSLDSRYRPNNDPVNFEWDINNNNKVKFL